RPRLGQLQRQPLGDLRRRLLAEPLQVLEGQVGVVPLAQRADELPVRRLVGQQTPPRRRQQTQQGKQGGNTLHGGRSRVKGGAGRPDQAQGGTALRRSEGP